MTTRWYRFECKIGVTDDQWPTLTISPADLTQAVGAALGLPDGTPVDDLRVTILREPRPTLRERWHRWRDRKRVLTAAGSPRA